MVAAAVVLVLGAPVLYFGILFATRDPVLNSLDRLEVPQWAAQSAEDRIISGSRWCFIDCRLRERTLQSVGEPADTTAAYHTALREAGWSRWDVAGCPQVRVDGDYSCWTRDEYTLDLWVHPPECAYDPLNLRPELAEKAEQGDDPQAAADSPPGDECAGSVVEIKMQNRVSDERGLPGSAPGPPGDGFDPASTAPTAPPSPTSVP